MADTRDHRRQYKDPALRTISRDFLLNLMSNLRQLNIDHTLVLTTEEMCRKLQREHCQYSCAWTSAWHSHPGLSEWNLKAGDMFLLWQQQWRYISMAMAKGYRVLRADTDVYFAEDPYAVLHGPLLRPYSLVVQQDFGGPLGRRPSGSGVHSGTALANVGLLYARSLPGGGGFGVINGTWARFVQMLGEPRRGRNTEALIDQPIMRDVLNELSVAHQRKPKGRWLLVDGGSADVYGGGDASCALADAGKCAAVRATRATTPFLAQRVQVRGGAAAESVALAPDWLFGRGCLTHVKLRSALDMLEAARPGATSKTTCEMPPGGAARAMTAPGASPGVLVAVHFVYSMALKRKRTFKAFAWDVNASHRQAYAPGACWKRAQRGILVSRATALPPAAALRGRV